MGNNTSKQDENKNNIIERRLSRKRSSSQQITSKRKKKKLQISVPHHDAKHPHSTISKSYVLGEPLGQGHYGIVRKCFSVKTGEAFAVKIIPKWKVENPELVISEIKILSKLNHPNVVQYIETIEDYDTYYIVMELCT